MKNKPTLADLGIDRNSPEYKAMIKQAVLDLYEIFKSEINAKQNES